MRDLRGVKFGRWTAIEFAEYYRKKFPVWWCECECGTRKRVKAYTLVQGASKSCGCLSREAASNRKTHGMSETPTYSSWLSMKWRCGDTPSASEKYNKLGYDPRWESFDSFFADMGVRPDGTSLDRIDGTKGYSNDNCRWATAHTQANNSTHVRTITYLGITRSVTDWAKAIGISRLTLSDRLRRGWSVPDALTKHVRGH